MIEGLKVKQLRQIHDERGYLMEMLRSDWPEFDKFGQCYFTVAYPDVVKGWHYHKIQTDHFIVVKGTAKVVCYDGREGSKTKGEVNEFFPGERNPMLIKIPPLVMHGFKAIGGEPAFIVNVPTELYRYDKPDEHRVPFDSPEVPYDWKIKMR
jgi:dTDP-4-dehydrorhamnose 3,5-epimerase